MTNQLTRRTALTGGIAAATASICPARTDAVSAGHERLLSVIRRLEVSQGWEPSNVAAAKHFAAFKMRQALGLGAPDESIAHLHVEYQQSQLRDYERTVWAERDRAEGKLLRNFDTLEREAI